MKDKGSQVGEFGQTLRRLMDEADISMSRLSYISDACPSMLRGYLKRGSLPARTGTVISLCEALGCDNSVLFEPLLRDCERRYKT